MHIRKLLIPLVGRENDHLGLDLGLGLARDLCAHLDAIFVRPDPEDTIPYMGLELADAEEKYRQRDKAAAKKAAARSRRHFNSACKKHGIERAKQPGALNAASARWAGVTGRATEVIAEAAKLCDLTIFARPASDYPRLLPNVQAQTLLQSGRPLLFVPNDRLALPPTCVAIAWDSSLQVVRAVGAAAPFLQEAKRIKVLSVRRELDDAVDPTGLVEFLAWHGLDAEGIVIERTHGSVGNALLARAQEIEPNLLVMGGYAHSRFEEAVFGGTTLHAIQHSPIPIFMMH